MFDVTILTKKEMYQHKFNEYSQVIIILGGVNMSVNDKVSVRVSTSLHVIEVSNRNTTLSFPIPHLMELTSDGQILRMES